MKINEVRKIFIGDKIKEIRESKGMSKIELAEKSELSRNSIYKYEKGEMTPKLGALQKIASALDVPITTFSLDSNDKEETNTSIYEILETLDKLEKPLDKNFLLESFEILMEKYPTLKARFDLIASDTDIRYLLLLTQKNKEIEFIFSIPSYIRADFAIIQPDDSMNGSGIFKNDIIFVCLLSSLEQPANQSLHNDNDVFFLAIDDSVLIRRIYHLDSNEDSKEKVILIADNPVYNPIVIEGAKIPDIEIIGKVVAVLKHLIPL